MELRYDSDFGSIGTLTLAGGIFKFCQNYDVLPMIVDMGAHGVIFGAVV